jgi:hypothetical protein
LDRIENPQQKRESGVFKKCATGKEVQVAIASQSYQDRIDARLMRRKQHPSTLEGYMMPAFDSNSKPQDEYHSSDHSHDPIKGSAKIKADFAFGSCAILFGPRGFFARRLRGFLLRR